MEGRKEGEGGGRRGRRHEAEVTSVVAYKAPSAVQGERKKGKEKFELPTTEKSLGSDAFHPGFFTAAYILK